ncbi:hypothetical protein WJX84_008396 [Apatococcus fuscideae]
MDGTGVFFIFHRFFEHLGQIAGGKPRQSYPQREFVELKNRIPQEAASIPQPTLPADYMRKLSNETSQASDGKSPRVEAIFGELSKEVTANLEAR